MLTMLAQGKLVSDPRSREAANGNPYVTASLACDTANGSILVGLLAFGVPAERLAALHKGDAVAASGEGKLTAWEKGGEQHHGLSLTVAELLSVYVARKRRGGSVATDHAEGGAGGLPRQPA